MVRSKGAAAALDFFIWGSGHAYLGFRKAAGLPWVIWTIIFGVYVLISAGTEASGSFYYFDPSSFTGIGYDTGAALTFLIVPFLLVGGLMVLDLMRKGGIRAPGPMSGAPGQSAPQTMSPPAMSTTPAASKFCPSCGTALTGADAFCPSCGARLQASAQPMPAPVAMGGNKVCVNCGTANPAGFAFCKRCGNRVA